MKKSKLAVKCILPVLLLTVSLQASSQAWPKSPIPVPSAPSSLLPGKKAPAVTDIWVVFKTHCDLGFTMSASEVFKKYREDMMDNAIRMIEADRLKPAEERFKWTIAGWPMAGAILGPLQTPERRAKIEQALREGSIAVHGLPCTMESDAFELEDYVRGLNFSSSLARQYGQPLPIAAKMTDVPAHSWLLPTLLNNAGIKFLQIGANYSDRPVLLPQLFWWVGPDGSRILCNYTAQYGSDITPPRNWPSKNYLAVMMTHDNEGPPSPKEVDAVIAKVDSMKGVKLHLATLDEFAKALLAENPDLPVIRGDMVDPWIHGVMSMPVETKIARNIRPLQSAVDVLNTQLQSWGIHTSPLAPSLAQSYENSLLYGEHTWGGNTPGWGFFSMDGKNRDTERYLYGDAFLDARKNGYYQKFEASFEDHKRYIKISDSIVTGALSDRLSVLAQSVKSIAGEVVVYNPLPWPRSGMVVIDGRQVMADNVPASGYKTISLHQPAAVSRVDANTNTLQTRYFKVQFDLKRGGIASLIEKSTGRDWVDQHQPYALGQYVHEQFSHAQTVDYYNRFCTKNNAANGTYKPNMPDNVPYSISSADNWTLMHARSSVADVVTLTSTSLPAVAQSISIKFTFPAEQPYAEVEWKITGKKPSTLPEGGWLSFPFNVANPQYLAGRIGGTMNLATDQITGGNRYLYGINTGTAITARDHTGMGLCAIDAPLLSFGEPGLWKYDYDYFPKKPTVFVNLYNNMWNCNYPFWTEGAWSERVRIWGIKPDEKSAENLAVKSWEARVPLMAIAATGQGTKLPSQQSGISVSRKGVLLTAFGTDPDGNKGTLLRLWEQAGKSGEVTISLPGYQYFTKATPVNLRGEVSGKTIPVKNEKFICEIKEFGPASFILE
ncbi:glycoside hydrolase family 38 N-terminal domain-containing protein [Solitalea koreensis]|uniref:Glycosyl hydrolases family 38 N-terminal domain-containing protein n=1 Tax=Solitalea koreensis TaxID=543615 RepID=A0A521DKB6_9SPHI|nr:hypothetical protein [Solitalea koreensis]SMO72022.1 Glycosyl hydrolases family 38 N-terminal domain-containing protein [Solitalea koreensis]